MSEEIDGSSLPEVEPTPEIETAPTKKKKIKDMSAEELRAYNKIATDRHREKKRGGAPKKQVGRPPTHGTWVGLVPGTVEYKDADKRQHQKDRDKKLVQRDEDAKLIGSTDEPKGDDAKQILRSSGVRNPHVQDVLAGYARVAAAYYKIPYNQYLLQHGLRKTLADLNSEPFEPPVIGEDEIIDGEILYKSDLHYLWDMGYWRQSATFSEWLDIRFKAKSSAFYLGKEILGMDFHELHEQWSKFFPQFSPVGLKINFTMEDAKVWLGRQAEKKTFALSCSRSSYKSSFAAILAVCIVLCQPSIRIRLVTSVDDLASDFVSVIKRYFIVDQPDSPSLFAQIFGEYCLTPDSAGQADVYDCPLRHLNLVASTIVSSSMSSKQVGRRAEILLLDDVQDQDSVATDSLREKGMARFDLLGKLVEVGGYIISLSTFWHKQDITATLIERAKNDPDSLTSIRIDPAWEVLPHASKIPILELKETDVVLAFPERLTFKFLMSEAKKNLKQFKSQNLCEVPDDSDGGVKVHFDLDQLHASVRSYSFFDRSNPALELIGTYTGLDCGWSVSKFADYSALITCKVFREIRTGKFILGVTDIRLAQLRIQELAKETVRCIKENAPDRMISERSGSWQSLAMAIQNEARDSQVFPQPNIYWRPIGTVGQKNKAARIKALEAPLSTGQLFFKQHPVLDELFTHMTNYTGGRSGSSLQKKDDSIDALALVAEQFFFPLYTKVLKTEAESKEEADLLSQRWLQMQHQSYFGTGVGQLPQSTQQDQEPPDATRHYGFRR